jgi:hypothetical protein
MVAPRRSSLGHSPDVGKWLEAHERRQYDETMNAPPEAHRLLVQLLFSNWLENF